MKSKRLMTIGIVLALLIAVVGVVLSVSLTACGKDVITVRSEKELLKAAGTSQEKTIVLMDDVVVNGDLKVAAPNKIDLNGFGLEVKGTLSADGSGTLVVGTTALILARRETVKAQKIDINMPQGHVEWNAHIDLPASAATSADAMTVVTSASSFVFKGVFKIGGAEADIMLTLKGGRFEISNMSESSAATVLVPEQAVGAAVENLSQGAMRVEAHSDVAVGGEVEISSKNSEVNVTALESQAETKITVTDGTVKKIDAAGAQVVVAESAQAGDVVADHHRVDELAPRHGTVRKLHRGDGRRPLEACGAYEPHNGAGFHSTGTCGTFGAAAAAARILGLSVRETQNALGLASSFSSGRS